MNIHILRMVIFFFSVTFTAAILFSPGRTKADVGFIFTPMEGDAFRAQQRATATEITPPVGPPEEYEGNPVDWFLEPWFENHGVSPPEPLTDNLFARRAFLDVIGLLPSVDELRGFVSDRTPDKDSALIDRLLGDRQGYAEHWMTFWNDLLRNDEQTNIDNLREPITRWLYSALLENMPYDQMVVEMLNPSPNGGPGGFLKGVNWRGEINASQTPVIQAAQNIGQVFMAAPLKCASCHNHFTRSWQLVDVYGLAACFSEEEELELVRCDSPTGEVTQARFPFEGLGEIDPQATLYERRGQAASMVVSPKNPRFAPTMVNRLFHRLMGRGLFEPVDDLDFEPLFPELLEWMAYEFIQNDYDLKHILRLILTSDAYRRAAIINPLEFTLNPTYAAPTLRRLQSEQFVDAIYTVTHYQEHPALMNVEVDNPRIRAWRHRTPRALETALGRPNREQVVSEREDQATVLQMLELVNGDVFSEILRNASERMRTRYPNAERHVIALIERTFWASYSRAPTEAERDALLDLFGDATESEEAYREAIEDLLWIVFMSPEFQFIY